MLLLALGNPLLDIIADVEAELLEEYGLKLDDNLQAEERHRELFLRLLALPRAKLVAGGMVQNSARVAQWMLQQPSATAFVGCIGADELAPRMREACEHDGVEGIYMVDPRAPTGCCACLLRGEERAMCVDLQAARNYSVEHLRQHEVWRRVQEASVIYTTVNFPAEALWAAARESARSCSIFGVNLAAPFWIRRLRPLLLELLPFVDVLFGNEGEAAAWAEAEGWGAVGVEAVALRLSLAPSAKKRERTVVVTQGAEETIVAVQGRVSRQPVVQLERGLVRDTTGAGDAYAGGFLAGLCRGLDVQGCCRAGAYGASIVVQNLGCTFAGAPEFAWEDGKSDASGALGIRSR